MKITAILLMLLSCSPAFAQAAKPQTKVNPATAGKIISGQEQRDLIESYERKLLAADKKHDWDAIARRLAPDFLEIAGDGHFYNKEQVAKYFPEMRVTDYTISDVEFRSLGPAAALIAYHLDVQAAFQGKSLPGSFLVSTVWAKQHGEWMVVFHQGTPIPKQSPASQPAAAD